jgi:Cdc6-like AAA superfamily ATPase
LASVLRPVIDGDPAGHALLFGPSGAGKTCIAKYCLDEISRQHLGVHTHHIDCWQYHTRRKVIEELCIGCGQGGILHSQQAHDDLLDRIREVEEPYIVVLDEVDQLDDLTVLRELYGMDGVAIVGIANRERELFSRVDDWLNTRLRTCTTITLDAYADSELVDILQRRATVALAEGAVSDRQLETIARYSEGNAGLAIGTLRLAARHAQEHSAGTITDTIIREAKPAAAREERQKSISRLTREQRLLFEQLPDDGSWKQASAVYDAYVEASDDPTGRRNRRLWMAKMQQYNLVEKRGQGRGTEYRQRLKDGE